MRLLSKLFGLILINTLVTNFCVGQEAGSVEPRDDKKLISNTQAYLKDISGKDEFSGTVLIAKNGKQIWSGAYGVSNRQTKELNKIDTKYNLGSINKIFTVLALGILADEGKLKFDDTIGKHIPTYPNKAARDTVTIRHLITMSSGIGDIFGPEFNRTPKSKLRTIDSYLPLFASKPLAFEPGKGRAYSNGGYLVLGAIIERASGQNYYDFVRERIYKPIGMQDTEAYESDATIPNIARGYTYSPGQKKRVDNINSLPARGSSGGGGYSTAPDLLKFANAIENGTFAVPQSLRTIKDRMTAGLLSKKAGFGGGGPGINAIFRAGLGSGYTLVVLSNYDSPSASTVFRKIRGWIGR